MPVERLNLTNPVDWKHPLNKQRRLWCWAPKASGRYGGNTWFDLCGNFNGTFEAGSVAPAWQVGVPNGPPSPFFGGTGGGNGWNVNFGARSALGLSLTDNFTVGIQFRPATVAPIDINGLAGLIGKYHDGGDLTWYLRQHDAEVQFGGSSQLASGNFLSTSVTSRVVAVMNAGTCTIYHQGDAVASGAVAISADTTAVVRVGADFFSSPRYYIGWIEEVFVVARPWTAAEVKLDRELSLKQYQVDRSPLRFLDTRLIRTTDSGQTVSFTTTVGAMPSMGFANTPEFTTRVNATAGAGGMGPVTPEGTPEFVTNVGVLLPFQAGEPTLVNFTTPVVANQTLQAGAPANFTTTVRVDEQLRTIPNGDPRILSQKRYRR